MLTRSPAAIGRRWWLRLLLAILLSTVLVMLLLRITSPAEIVGVLAGSNMWLLLAGFIVYAAANWFKGLRFHLVTLTDRPITRFNVFLITCLYNLATGLLPFGTGEISYPYLMRRWYDVGISQSTPALVITRLFDLIMVSLIFLISTLVIHQQLVVPLQLLIVATTVLAGATAGLILAPWIGDRVLTLLAGLGAGWWRGRLRQVRDRVLIAGRRFTGNLREGRERGQVPAIGFYSLTIWGLSYLVFAVVIRALGYDFNFWMAVFGGSLALMTNLLPIQGVAGLGVREVGWMLGLTALGFTPAEATALAFGIHAVTLSYLILLGLLAGLIVAVRRRFRGEVGVR